QNGELGAGVAAIEIFRGVGLGVSTGLCFFERFAERNARILDAAKYVVAGAVENSCDAMQSISAEACAKGGEDRHSSRHRGAEFKMTASFSDPLQQIRAV